MDEGGAHVALGNRCPTHRHRTQRRRLVMRLGENPCNRHMHSDDGTSPRRLCDVTSEGVAVCICSTGRKVANGVRSNGDKANGPCAIYEGERFLLLGVAISDPHCSTR